MGGTKHVAVLVSDLVLSTGCHLGQALCDLHLSAHLSWASVGAQKPPTKPLDHLAATACCA